MLSYNSMMKKKKPSKNCKSKVDISPKIHKWPTGTKMANVPGLPGSADPSPPLG
jgi:hypothetical protein